MIFYLAFNYGSRLELVHALKKCIGDNLNNDMITEQSINQRLWTAGAPDVDFLIRTSGEFRISNFLLWQSAYAELYLTKCLWPDFCCKQFNLAIEDYSERQRRFGSCT